MTLNATTATDDDGFADIKRVIEQTSLSRSTLYLKSPEDDSPSRISFRLAESAGCAPRSGPGW